jgi:hypothetical protein
VVLLVLAWSWVVALALSPGHPEAAAAGSGSSSGSAKTSGAGSAKPSAAPPSRPRPPKPKPGAPGSVLLPAGQPLPDTLLALVGVDRPVTTSQFGRAWSQVTPPARPDTLTPEGARRFLDLLIDKEVLAARAVEETWEWTTVESAQVVNLRDRTMMRVMLDTTLARFAAGRAARGEPKLVAEALGVAARESTVAGLEVRYDEPLVGRLARAFAALPVPSADSSIWARLRVMGQMPVIERGDSLKVVAWSTVGTERVADLLGAGKTINPLFRPRVETPDQVRDLVENGLFERVLRREAAREGYDRHPAVLEAVRRQEEFLASQYFVTREVYATIPVDEATLRRYYDRDPGVWAIPTRLEVMSMVNRNRSEASRMAVRLRDRAEADTIAARGLRQGVDYTTEITARSDSALFASAMKSGTGTVLGPDSVATGWQVVRVNAVIPAQPRSFDQVRDLVLRAWTEDEGERRMQALLASLRKRTSVAVNQAGLDRMVRIGVAAPKR